MFLVLWCCALAPMSLAAGLTYRIEGGSEEVRENLRAHLGASPEDTLEAERFLVTAPARAERALEALGYYHHRVAIDVDRSSPTWRAVLSVEEGEVLRYTAVQIHLTGEGGNDEALRRLVDDRAPAVGDPVHHGRYERFKSDLQQLARQRGYFEARLGTHRIAVDAGERTARLELDFATGRRHAFGALLADEALLAPDFLERLAPFERGDPYTQRRLLELRQRLLRLGYYSSVVVLPEVADRSDGQVPIRVDVVLSPSQSFEVGVGFSTDTRQRVSLLWRTPRINRHGHSQQTSLRWSPVNPELRTAYTIPLNDPSSDLLQIIGRLENNEFGDLQSNQQEFALRRERTPAGRVIATQLRGLREDWDALGEDFSATFLLAGASYSKRSRQGPAVDPDSGISQFYDIELASSAAGSDEDLVRVHTQLVAAQRFGDRWRAVGRLEGGVLYSSSERPDELPPSLSFFAGGDNSIRGFGYQSVGREIEGEVFGRAGQRRRLVVGGTRLLTGSIELQRYVTPSWRVAVFADGGDAFVEDDFDLNVGVGVGVHYLSPVGALRFEVADPVTDDDLGLRIHINIGAEF